MTNDQRTQSNNSRGAEEICDRSARSEVSQNPDSAKDTMERLDATLQSDIYLNTDSPDFERSRLRPPAQCDMHGNIAEMCSDVFHVEYFAELSDVELHDPVGSTAPQPDRVVRGGSYLQYGIFCRSSAKDRIEFSERRKGVGFRVVLSVDAGRALAGSGQGADDQLP